MTCLYLRYSAQVKRENCAVRGTERSPAAVQFYRKMSCLYLEAYPEIFDFAEGLMQSFPKSLIWQKATARFGAQHGKAIPTATPARYTQLNREINSKVLRIS